MASNIETHDGIRVLHRNTGQCHIIDTLVRKSFTIEYNERPILNPLDKPFPITYNVDGDNVSLRELLAYARERRVDSQLVMCDM